VIPGHLQGKNAEQIVEESKEEYENHAYNKYLSIDYKEYLEKLLLLAVKDALMSADGKNLCDGDYELMGSEAECRAIAFLDMVLPYEEKKDE